jgi:hypothetical protein
LLLLLLLAQLLELLLQQPVVLPQLLKLPQSSG